MGRQKQVRMVKILEACICQEQRIKRLLANGLFLTAKSITLIFSTVTAPGLVATMEVVRSRAQGTEAQIAVITTGKCYV